MRARARTGPARDLYYNVVHTQFTTIHVQLPCNRPTTPLVNTPVSPAQRSRNIQVEVYRLLCLLLRNAPVTAQPHRSLIERANQLVPRGIGAPI